MLDLLKKRHLKDIAEKNQGYFSSGALQVTILRKVSRCLAFSQKWVGNHFYIAKLALIYLNRGLVVKVTPLLSGLKVTFYNGGSKLSKCQLPNALGYHKAGCIPALVTLCVLIYQLLLLCLW